MNMGFRLRKRRIKWEICLLSDCDAYFWVSACLDNLQVWVDIAFMCLRVVPEELSVRICTE